MLKLRLKMPEDSHIVTADDLPEPKTPSRFSLPHFSPKLKQIIPLLILTAALPIIGIATQYQKIWFNKAVSPCGNSYPCPSPTPPPTSIGQVTAYLGMSPMDGIITINSDLYADIIISPTNTNSVKLSTVQFYLSYPYYNIRPELLPIPIPGTGTGSAQLSPGAIPFDKILVNSISIDDVKKLVKIAFVGYKLDGFDLTGPTVIATAHFRGVYLGKTMISFDESLSKVISKYEGNDVLNHPLKSYLVVISESTPPPSPTPPPPTPTTTPTPTCYVLPTCLYASPPCKVAIPVNPPGGFCPTPTPTPTPYTCLNVGSPCSVIQNCCPGLFCNRPNLGPTGTCTAPTPTPIITPIAVTPTPTALPTITFKVKFQGIGASSLKLPKSVRFTLSNSSGTYIRNYLMTADANAVYSFQGNLYDIPYGYYTVAIKGPSHLERTVPNIYLGSSKIYDSSLQPPLKTGDVAGGSDKTPDDMVDASDLGQLISLYNPTSPPPLNPSLARFDLNDDGVIDIADIGLLITNFNPGKYGE